MDKQYDSAFSERRAVRPLSVIVVGAGIGGLALGYLMRKTGHDVGAEVILERRMEIAEVGAGLQLAPNCLRILRRFGLLDETMKHATVLERNSLRRWMDDEELGSIPLVPDVEDHFGAPLAVIHRADLQRILYDAAIRSGCKILKDHEVIDVDQQFLPVRHIFFRLRVHVRIHGLRDTWMSADLVLAADGMNSIVRKQLAAAGGYVDQLVPIQESAYRFVLPKELVKHDEKIMSLLNKNQGMRYLGPGGHIMAYPLRNNTLYNVVLVRAADGELSNKTSWTTYGKKEKILECYREWCPLVRALISHVPSSGLLETPMSNMLPLPTWYKGKIALAGDACHYMLPYVAQGAANAIEDAGTLAMAFTCTDQIELALELYQLVRKDRSERIQASAGNNGLTLHLPDGEEQRRRDESIRAASRGTSTANPDQWSDRENREFMWNVDVMAETIEKFESLAQETGISHDS
ncbi:putative salicylate hydroxylase [Xylaria flabelliformis]|nr:putative salicylate hydroxylase [Xylaria flabelliformis]